MKRLSPRPTFRPMLEALEGRDLPSTAGLYVFFLSLELQAESTKVQNDMTQLQNDVQSAVLSQPQVDVSTLGAGQPIPTVPTGIVNDFFALKSDSQVLETTTLAVQPLISFVAIQPGLDNLDVLSLLYSGQTLNKSFGFLKNLSTQTEQMADDKVTLSNGKTTTFNNYLTQRDQSVDALFTGLQSTLPNPPAVFGAPGFFNSVLSPGGFGVFTQSPLIGPGSFGGPSFSSPSPFGPSVFSPSPFGSSFFSPSPFGSSFFSPSPFGPSFFGPSPFGPSFFGPPPFSGFSFFG